MSKKAIRNTYAQPISALAQHMYNDLLKRNERAILDEADPKVTYITDNNMQVTKFIALGGDSEKRIFDKEKFRFMGQIVELPYERVNYNVIDMQTGKVTPSSVRYLDTKDTELVAEIYKEFYRMAEFLVSQEIAMKGLLPTLTEKGEYIVDPKTGLPLVGSQYLEYYFGLTMTGSQDEKARANAIADVNRWAYGSFLYQIKASRDTWKEIHKKFRSGDINKYGVGPALDNIGVSDFQVNDAALRPTNFISGTTAPERATFEFSNNKSYRSDLANMLVATQNGNFTAQPAPQGMNNNIQPSVQAQPATQGPIQPVQPVQQQKGTTKIKK